MCFMYLVLMPRRIPDYPDAFAGWNFVSSLGSLISVGATVLFLYIVYDLFTNTSVATSSEGLHGKETSNNTNNIENYDNNNTEIHEEPVNRNTWSHPVYYVNGEIYCDYSNLGNTLEYSVNSPIPTHVYNNTPLLGENRTLLLKSSLNIFKTIFNWLYNNKLLIAKISLFLSLIIISFKVYNLYLNIYKFLTVISIPALLGVFALIPGLNYMPLGLQPESINRLPGNSSINSKKNLLVTHLNMESSDPDNGNSNLNIGVDNPNEYNSTLNLGIEKQVNTNPRFNNPDGTSALHDIYGRARTGVMAALSLENLRTVGIIPFFFDPQFYSRATVLSKVEFNDRFKKFVAVDHANEKLREAHFEAMIKNFHRTPHLTMGERIEDCVLTKDALYKLDCLMSLSNGQWDGDLRDLLYLKVPLLRDHILNEAGDIRTDLMQRAHNH